MASATFDCFPLSKLRQGDEGLKTTAEKSEGGTAESVIRNLIRVGFFF